jgi:hypothetical protein
MRTLFPDDMRIICYSQLFFRSKEPYLYFIDGTNFISIAKPEQYKFSSGKQLYVLGINIMFLNRKLSDKDIKTCLHYINNMHFRIPMKPETVNRIVTDVVKRCKEDTINPYYKKRHLIFNPSIPITLSEKRKITGRICGAKTKIDEEIIYDVLEECLELDIIPYFRSLAKRLKVNERTVRNHMTMQLKEYQGYVKISIREKAEKRKHSNTV